tara:strand:+ start:1288 stop:1491 length:204 start_codon:yes stop_codon:yes gene_type:complete
VKIKPQNQAGIMGANSYQPAQELGRMTVDPLERLQQKQAGRTHGRILDGILTKKPKPTLMTRKSNGK